jgi:hypothetical protein
MKKYLTPQTRTDCFSIGMVLVALLATGLLWRGHHYSTTFKQTPPRTTLAALKSQWGEPDCICPLNAQQLKLCYNRGCLATTYQFVFKDSVLIEKRVNN